MKIREMREVVPFLISCHKYYLQIQGTAMGTKMAPAYANLLMGKLEEKLNELGKPHIVLWKRFIEDILILSSGPDLHPNSQHT